MKTYLYNVGIALSILLNVTLGGKPHQTFSARNYQRRREGLLNIASGIDKILGDGHCLECWVNHIIRERNTK